MPQHTVLSQAVADLEGQSDTDSFHMLAWCGFALSRQCWHAASSTSLSLWEKILGLSPLGAVTQETCSPACSQTQCQREQQTAELPEQLI